MPTQDQLKQLAILLDEDPQAVDDEGVKRRLREKLPDLISQIPRITREDRNRAEELARIFGISVPPYRPSKRKGAS